MDQMVTYRPAGDNGIIIEFGKEISPEINGRIRSFQSLLMAEVESLPEIIEQIPAYTTLLILYNPLICSYNSLEDKLKSLMLKLREGEIPEARVLHIPVIYGREYGPDLSNVAEHNKLTTEEVIEIHSGNDYLIYMIGFTPGFPYLGGMSEKIATPRLKVPRQRIPTGSVGIAGNQTGIYPIESPGGWQLIGSTPLKLFDLDRQPASLLRAGDYIRFEAIDEGRYNEIKLLVENNQYEVKTTILGEGRIRV